MRIRVVTKWMDRALEVREGTDAAESAILRWAAGKERVWLDLEGASSEEAEFIRRSFRFDEHSMQDALKGNHPPKVEEVVCAEETAPYLFVVFTTPSCDDAAAPESLALFLRPRLLVTFRRGPLKPVEDALARLLRDPNGVMGRGIEFAAHALVDEMVDGYERLLDAFDRRIDVLEDELERGSTDGIFVRILDLRGDASRTWRDVRPLRDVASCLAREGHPLIKPQSRLAFRDVYDHVQRTHDRLESQREAIYSIRDAHLALSNNRMNEVMKTLTVVAVLSGFLSVWTGLLGMNLDIPGGKLPHAFWVAVGGMAIATAGIVLWFRRRRWI